MTTYTKHLSEPWFSLIKIGAKTCEGRLNKGDFETLNRNDYLVFENSDLDYKRSFRCKVTSLHNYNSFKEYLESESLARCLPGIDTIEEGVRIYGKYYSPKDEEKYKIRAIRLRPLKH
jgi:ASC-1-like (ASCH) protein